MMTSKLHFLLFVGVAKYEWPRWIQFSDVCEHLNMMKTESYNGFTIIKVVAKEKGRLQTSTQAKEHIGSLSVSIRYKDKRTNTYSNANILIFRGSVRVASGIPQRVQQELHDKLNNEPLNEYFLQILEALSYWTAGTIQAHDDRHIVNINAQTKGSEIMRFIAFCRTKLYDNSRFGKVQLPFFHERGAVATCHVYPLQDSNASAKLQHTGAVQYLGFEEVDMLYVFSRMIDDEVKAWKTVKTCVNSCI